MARSSRRARSARSKSASGGAGEGTPFYALGSKLAPRFELR
jgi:hypothetical protein